MSGSFLNRSQIALQFEKQNINVNAPHFNMKIKCIIIEGDKFDATDCNCKIKPQQVACIITEKVKLNLYQIGFLYPKQKIYKRGLWVVEPGYIHPGYEGFLRIHVVNMSTKEVRLKIGDDILELLIFQNTLSFATFPDSSDNKDKTYEQYLDERLDEEIGVYPATFMAIDENIERVTSMIIPKWLQRISSIIAIAMLIFAGLQFYSYVKINMLVDDAINIEKIDVANELEVIKSKLNKLERNQKNK